MTREELHAAIDGYLAALAAGDPARLSLAQGAVFSENNVRLEIGDGLWNTVSGVRDSYDLRIADPEAGQAAWFGIVEEHGHPAIMSLRLAVAGGRITEVETIVCRAMEFGPFPSIETYVAPRPIMLAGVPPNHRVARNDMIRIANGYFETLELNDGTLHTEFTDDCDRVENGLQTTNNPNIEGYPIAAMGCADQFRQGQYIYDDRLRDRRFPLVDEEKGIVLAGGFIDHCGKVVDVTWTDGVTKTKSVFHFPHSFVLMEMFKIEGGKIAGVEAVFVTVPYNMPSAW